LVGADLVKGVALGVATGERGDGGGVAARVRLRLNYRGECDGNIDNNRRGFGGSAIHDQFLQILV
jgi:hypothetical protein